MAASITLTPVPSAVTSGPPGMYTRGEELELNWSVRNTAGVLTAPAGLTFTVRSPDGVDTEYVAGSDAEITDNADGTGTLILVLDQSARWFFRCVTDTPTTAAETDVIVQRSALEDAVVPVPGDPGAAYNGAIARAASGVYSPYLAEEEGETLTARETNGVFFWVKERGWLRPSVDTTGAVSARSAINAALATRAGVCVVLPEGNILIDGPIAISQAASTLLGTSETQTALWCSGSATGWIVADGIVTPSVRNLCVRALPTGAAPSSGVGVQMIDCFAPKLENVHVTEMFNGVQLDGCLEALLTGRIWFRNLFGVKGLEVVGNSGSAERVIADNPYHVSADSKVHRARVAGASIVAGDTYVSSSGGHIFQCTADGTLSAGAGPVAVPGTNVGNAKSTDVTDGTATVRYVGGLMEWIYGGADVAGFTIQSCALIDGYRGFRQAGGNWWFFGHAEIDHPWAGGITLSGGSGFRSTNNMWISSVFTGDGVLVDTAYSGDVSMKGGRIFAPAARGVLLQPGPTECYFEGMSVGTAGGLAGMLAGASGAIGPQHFAFRNNRVTDCNFGIAALSSNADYFHVTGNDCEGNSTSVDMSGASGTNVVVEQNLP